MNLINLTPELTQKYRGRLIDFIEKHGDRRITKEAIQWLRNVQKDHVFQEGTVVTVALDDKIVIGILIVVNYGINESFMVVHKQFRNQNVVKYILSEAISQISKIYGRIAMDNIPSLKVCLDNDMIAFHLFEGPTGKPTLWLGGGAWSKNDVI